jgi:hypothetical protein
LIFLILPLRPGCLVRASFEPDGGSLWANALEELGLLWAHARGPAQS